MILVADSLFEDHKNGPGILSAISEVQSEVARNSFFWGGK